MKKMMADLAVFSPLPTGCSTENDKMSMFQADKPQQAVCQEH